MATHPVVHFEVAGPDGAALQKFYADLFDWKVSADNPMNYGLVDAAEAGIGGGITQTQDAAQPPSVTFYVQVDDLQAYLDKAERLGAKTLMPPTEIPDMVTFAMFADPAGNTIGILKG